MKRIPLTKGKTAIVDDDDYARVAVHRWYYQSVGYAASGWRVNGKTYQTTLHRFIVGAEPGQYVDHINGDKLDCRRSNLRICTQSQNMQNMRNFRSGTSKFKGVSWYKRDSKWRSEIKVNKVSIHLGYFDDEIEAAKAYDRAAIEHFGSFACPNFSR